jgi:hypothetical protein
VTRYSRSPRAAAPRGRLGSAPAARDQHDAQLEQAGAQLVAIDPHVDVELEAIAGGALGGHRERRDEAAGAADDLAIDRGGLGPRGLAGQIGHRLGHRAGEGRVERRVRASPSVARRCRGWRR